jgi:FlaA1/EpsC-like NDP-sugar epimerase
LSGYLAETATVVLRLPRILKRLIVLGVDVSSCLMSLCLATNTGFTEFLALSAARSMRDEFTLACVTSIAIAVPVFIFSGLYRAIFRYSDGTALLAIAKAVIIYGILYFLSASVLQLRSLPANFAFIHPIILLFFIGLSRILAREWLTGKYRGILRRVRSIRVLIYGAGQAGQQLAKAISNSIEISLVGFLDDDKRLHGRLLNGLPVYNPNKLPDLVGVLKVNDVLLAMPSLPPNSRRRIIRLIEKSHVAVRTLPSMIDLAKGTVTLSDVTDLDINDLMDREPVAPNQSLLEQAARAKVILVTGAGGSIGAEICRQILTLKPLRIILFELSELALYEIYGQLALSNSAEGIELVPVLGSVQDEELMDRVIRNWCPDTIYHAAAYKHVPLVECNPVVGLQNNVFGTLSVAIAAARLGVTNFVLISTDKAVRPTNIMGAGKRMAEMILQALSAEGGDTRFSIVRFGNVLGSSGSVVPKFREQIRAGGPISVTHNEIERYFMSIKEAAELVIQAVPLARGGDVFVLDMGEPVKIIDLAKRMISLSGLIVKDDLNPDGDIEISIVGIRPGEKLFEELLIGAAREETEHPRIMRAQEKFTPWVKLEEELELMKLALSRGDAQRARNLLCQYVKEYQPKGDLADQSHLKNPE